MKDDDAQRAAIRNNRGLALRKSGRHAEAEQDFLAALRLCPGYAKAHYNLGLTLLDTARAREALPHFDAALRFDPTYAKALIARARTRRFLGAREEAEADLLRVLALGPTAPGVRLRAMLDRAELLDELDRKEESGYLFAQLETRAPDDFEVQFAVGTHHFGAFRFAEATLAFDKAVSADPDDAAARVSRLLAACEIADWRHFDEDVGALGASLARTAAPPQRISIAQALRMPVSAADQRRIAVRQAHDLCERARVAGRGPDTFRPPREGRIRLAYLSADFREHALMHLMAGVFRQHDRARFEVRLYSLGPDDGSAMRRRAMDDADAFIDLRLLDDQAAAARIRGDGIDVLVDLTGLSSGGRPGILALRPVPVQISAIGFPGTMGTGLVDYLLGDDVVCPPGLDAEFGETILRMPQAYLATDGGQVIEDPGPDRAAVGLPADATVFASFNGVGKIDPGVFALWMRLLTRVPGSVLWQYVHGRESGLVRDHLRQAAARAGVDPDRLVFAGLEPKARHLARLRLADLALDTPMCNGHTTTVDALWAGVPVVALRGATFATRVSASLLVTAGLPEMIAGSLLDYERIATALATDHGRLAGMRERLAGARLRSPLFDTARWVRAFEAHCLRLAPGAETRAAPFVSQAGSPDLQVVLVAGPWGSGTSMVAGLLERLGFATLGPLARTVDPRTPESYELLPFRDLITAFVDEERLSRPAIPHAPLVDALRAFLRSAGDGAFGDWPDPRRRRLALKMPLASLCLPELLLAHPMQVIAVRRSLADIEATRLRRNWAPHLGHAGGRRLYEAIDAAVLTGTQVLDIRYNDVVADPGAQLRRLAAHCRLSPDPRVYAAAAAFVRPAAA